MILLLPLKVKEYIYVKLRAIKAPEDERIIAATFEIVVSEGEEGAKKTKEKCLSIRNRGKENEKHRNMQLRKDGA